VCYSDIKGLGSLQLLSGHNTGLFEYSTQQKHTGIYSNKHTEFLVKNHKFIDLCNI
jgi:hypothetical protein